MQQQYQQAQQMDPLKIQEAQGTIESQRLANAAAQQQAKIGSIWQASMDEAKYGQASAPGPSPAAAPAVPPAGYSAPYAAVNLGIPPTGPAPLNGSTTMGIPETQGLPPFNRYDPESIGISSTLPDTGPSPYSAAGSSLANPGASGAPATVVPGSTAPAAAPRRVNDIFAQKMAAAGLGAYTAGELNKYATSQESQLRAQQMQRDMDDDEKLSSAYNESGGDLDKYMALAANKQVSSVGIARARQNMVALQTSLIKQHESETDLGLKNLSLEQKRHDDYATRLNAFLQGHPDDDTPDGIKANMGDFLAAARRDNLLTTPEYQNAVASYPTMGTPALRQRVKELTSSSDLLGNARTTVEQNLAAKSDRAALIDQLYAAQDPDTYEHILNASAVPHGDLPAKDQMFTADGNRIQAQFDNLNRLGLTAEQRQAADNAKANLQATSAYRTATLNQRGAHYAATEDIARTNAANKPQNQNAALQPLANQVWESTVAAMANRRRNPTDAANVKPEDVTPQDAINFLKDPTNWTKETNPDIDASRDLLIAHFAKSSTQDLNRANIAARTDATQSKGKPRGGFGGLTYDENGQAWMNGVSVGKPNLAKAAKKPQTAAPANTPKAPAHGSATPKRATVAWHRSGCSQSSPMALTPKS